MAGIKEVAQLAGVSVSTVSYVLSGKRSISRETRDKVMKVVRSVGYIPDASAQSLRGGSNHILALSKPIREGMDQVKYNAYFLETAKQAKNAGYDVLLLTSENAVEDIQRVMRSNLADGVILFDVAQDDERAALADSYGKPCVAIGYPDEHEGCACVDIDFTAMGKKAADIMYSMNHHSLVLLRGLESDYRRKVGYMLLFRQALMQRVEELGMTLRESEPIDYATFDAENFVHTMLTASGQATALINQADAGLLNSVLDAMEDDGIRVPDDCSILSCGTYFQSEFMHIPINEMPFDPVHLCSAAVDLLIEAIDGKRELGGYVKLFPPRLIDKGSMVKCKKGGLTS